MARGFLAAASGPSGHCKFISGHCTRSCGWSGRRSGERAGPAGRSKRPSGNCKQGSGHCKGSSGGRAAESGDCKRWSGHRAPVSGGCQDLSGHCKFGSGGCKPGPAGCGRGANLGRSSPDGTRRRWLGLSQDLSLSLRSGGRGKKICWWMRESGGEGWGADEGWKPSLPFQTSERAFGGLPGVSAGGLNDHSTETGGIAGLSTGGDRSFSSGSQTNGNPDTGSSGIGSPRWAAQTASDMAARVRSILKAS